MYGPYGYDDLNRFLMVSALICMVLSLFPRGHVFYVLAGVAMIYAYFRMFSRNIAKRSMENQWFLKKTMKLRGFFVKRSGKWGSGSNIISINVPTANKRYVFPEAGDVLPLPAESAAGNLSKRAEGGYVRIHYH